MLLDEREIQMKRLLSGNLVLWTAICVFCAAVAPAFGTAAEKAGNPAVSAATGPSTVVARIGPYTITREELEKQWLMDLRPYDYDYYDEDTAAPDAMSTLKKMVGEKAMVLEARAKGMLENERVADPARRYRQRRLANLLAQTHLAGKVDATDSEIEAKMKSDPKLDRARAEQMVKRDKARALWNRQYLQIYKKRNVKKFEENFSKVSQTHQRLLHHPGYPRRQSWILNSQVKDELTPEEKQTVLATFDQGKITLEDWFDALCDVVPPRRPKVANEGVIDKFLSAALQIPLLVAEARSQGLHKNPELLKQVREYEDRLLLGQMQSAIYKDVNEPTKQQMLEYFKENKEKFGTSARLKIDPIWCNTLAEARKVKAELDEGKDFEQVKQKYSLEKKLKAFTTQPGSETIFWEKLWAADPNTIVGPVKGFYRQGVKWRVVKILEKNPAEPKQYDEKMLPQIKDRMMSERRDALLAEKLKELLGKYTHHIYADKVKDIDVLDID
jgi:hypothetical protein